MGLFRFQAGKKEADSSISLLLEHRQEEAAWKVEKLFPGKPLLLLGKTVPYMLEHVCGSDHSPASIGQH